MCGIVGYIGKQSVVTVLLDGLKRLEYRGYDSAGIAVAGNCHGLELRRTQGKLAQLEQKLSNEPVSGVFGLGHTRWATHGPPSVRNSHPHLDCSGQLAIVHNGIIENYEELKQRLVSERHAFVSETDSEVIAHLIESNLNGDLLLAVRESVCEMQGSFAMGVISSSHPGQIVVARLGAPVIIGVGDQETLVASDIVPILPHTRNMIFLEDGELALLTDRGVEISDFKGCARSRRPVLVHWDATQAEKNGFKHFMQKEIFEQPLAVRDTLAHHVDFEAAQVRLDELAQISESVNQIERVQLIACGTSWHAALAGKWMIEQLAGLPAEVDHASEYRHRNPIADHRTLAILISQSGETADTLGAGRQARLRKALTLAITNVPGSTLMRESDATLCTRAGPEVGVAATKTFSAQLACMALLAIYLAQNRKHIEGETARSFLKELGRIPARLDQILQKEEDIERIAKQLYRARDFLFLGRGPLYPVSLEGALKLKEISYIHAEGYPAGEMKHGPNALIDENLPVVFTATYEAGNPASELRYQKTLSNIEEVRARDGIVLAIVNEGDEQARRRARFTIELPTTVDVFLPFLAVVPLQLLAYHIARLRDCDVDQPRNLAKSVTVE